MSARGKDMSDTEKDAALAAIVRDSADVIQRNSDANGFAFALSTNLAVAS